MYYEKLKSPTKKAAEAASDFFLFFVDFFQDIRRCRKDGDGEGAVIEVFDFVSAVVVGMDDGAFGFSGQAFVINDKSYVIEWFHRELLRGNGALPPRDDGFAVKREKGALGS